MNVKRSAWASRGISLQRGNRLFNGLAARARTLAYLSAPEHVGWGGIVDVPQQAPPLFSSEAPDGYYLFEVWTQRRPAGPAGPDNGALSPVGVPEVAG